MPADDAAHGLVYGGLQRRAGGPCGAGLLEVKGTSPVMCTHGPDAAPAGLSVKRRVAPLAAPSATTAAAAVQGLAVCEGDGTSGRRVEVLYIHGSTSRYSQYLETFRTLAEGVDTIFNESARETGGERHVRYVTETVNGACRPVVRDVRISDSALNANDWAPLLNAVKAAGYTRTDRKYLEFVDANVYCGIGGPGTNLARTATPSASYTSPWESVAAVNDGAEPALSNDTAHPRWGTWPNTGYPIAIDRYNRVTFGAVDTTRLRVLLRSGAASVGLLEVRAYAT